MIIKRVFRLLVLFILLCTVCDLFFKWVQLYGSVKVKLLVIRYIGKDFRNVAHIMSGTIYGSVIQLIGEWLLDLPITVKISEIAFCFIAWARLTGFY